MNSKWIKLEDLPEGFWEECFVAYRNKQCGSIGVFHSIVSVKKIKGELQWYGNSMQEWLDLREGFEYLVISIEYPEISQEDFK